MPHDFCGNPVEISSESSPCRTIFDLRQPHPWQASGHALTLRANPVMAPRGSSLDSTKPVRSRQNGRSTFELLGKNSMAKERRRYQSPSLKEDFRVRAGSRCQLSNGSQCRMMIWLKGHPMSSLSGGKPQGRGRWHWRRDKRFPISLDGRMDGCFDRKFVMWSAKYVRVSVPSKADRCRFKLPSAW